MALISTDAKNTCIKNISACYTQKVSACLIEIKSNSEKYEYNLDGYITNLEYSSKNFELLFFINSKDVIKS